MAISPKHNIDPIVRHYEECLLQYGDTPKGMDWPNGGDLARRYRVMTELVRDFDASNTVLDLGCGSGLYLVYLQQQSLTPPWQYSGIDISAKMIEVAQKARNAKCFKQQNVLEVPLRAESQDYVMMNGILTEKQSLSQKSMIAFAKDMIKAAYDTCRIGIAFNVMSKDVDWERDDLFHWGNDDISAFLFRQVSQHFVIRADYGLYECTVYVYRHPQAD